MNCIEKNKCQYCHWFVDDCIYPDLCCNFNKFKERKRFYAHWEREKHSKVVVYNPISDYYEVKYRCSNCFKLSLLPEHGKKYPYCPWCGAEMRQPEKLKRR